MICVGFVLLWLGIKKDCEPLLLVPIGFGCILANIPLSDVMSHEGFIRTIYDAGIATELFPLLIFVGIGAMTTQAPRAYQIADAYRALRAGALQPQDAFLAVLKVD